MSGKNKTAITIGITLIVLAALSFILALLNLPRWFYYAGVICMTLAIVFAAIYFLISKASTQPASRNTPEPSAQSAPAPASDLLRDAQQSAPLAPLKERQPQQERAFPPDKDQ